MTIRKWTFPSFTSEGSTVSTGDTPSLGDTAWSNITIQSGTTLTYTGAVAPHGGYSIKAANTTTANVCFSGWASLSATSMAIRAYFYATSFGSVAHTLIQIRNSGSQACNISLNGATPCKLLVQNSLGSTLNTFATGLSTSTWYRLELQAIKGTTTSNGTINAAYYNKDDSSPVDTAYTSGAAVNSGTSNFTECRFGKLSGTEAVTYYFCDFYCDDASSTAAGKEPLGGTWGAAGLVS